MSEESTRRILAVILVIFVGLGAAYALTTPTLEAPDEIHHYDYVRALVETGRPPVLEKGGGRGFGHHAPLYYAYGALASFWVDDSDLDTWRERRNPFFGYRFGEVGRDNKNLYVHPDSDTFGGSDTWLGIRVVRLASVLLGAATIWVVYRIGREVFPEHPRRALTAAGFSAFIPQFLFIAGAVNDDNGAALFGALALWSMVRILRKGASWRRCLGLGAALGLGWLSKLTTVALVPTAGLTLAVVAWRDRSWRTLLRWGVVTFSIAALLITPWLVRQTVLYGDPTGTSREMSEWGLRDEPVTLGDVGPDLYWLRTSFWGRLGHNQIPLSHWIYRLLDAISLLALLGLARKVGRRLVPTSRSSQPAILASLSRVRDSQLMVLAAGLLLSFGPMIVRRFLRPMPNFGRYLFPILPSIALLMVTGLATWLPPRYRSHLSALIVGAMLVLGISGLACFLAPAYARPPIYEETGAPKPEHRLDWTYLEDGDPLATLLGYTLKKETVQPDATVEVALHWRVLRETDKNHVLFTQLFGREAAKVGQRDTYPGLGHYPTSFWQPGEVIVDRIPIRVASEAVAPSRLRLDVGLYEQGGRRLPVVDDGGKRVEAATIGGLSLVSEQTPAPPTVSTSYRLGDSIELTGYDWQQDSAALHLALHWACRTPMDADYTVFAHLLDSDGNLAAQHDGPPIGGDYPTSYWVPDHTAVDRRTLNIEGLPPGTYDLRVGMYLLESMERLPVHDADGERAADDAVHLMEVHLP